MNTEVLMRNAKEPDQEPDQEMDQERPRDRPRDRLITTECVQSQHELSVRVHINYIP